MRAAAMGSSSAEAGGTDAVEAATSELLEAGVFGGYLGSPPTIR
jgi:hypothetical protein